MTDTTQTAPEAEQSDSVQNQGSEPQFSSPDDPVVDQSGDASASDPAEDAPKPEPKKTQGWQKRIDKLTYEAREAQRTVEMERLQRQNLEYELAQLRAGQQRPNPQQMPNDPFYDPNLSQQPIDPIANREQIIEEVQNRIVAQQQEQQLINRAADFIDEIPDPDVQAYLVSPHSGLTPEMAEVILALPKDRGSALATHLAHNQHVAEQLKALPVHMQAVQLATYEAQVAQAPAVRTEQAPPVSSVSQAPKPAPTVGGKGAVKKDPNKMSVEEWMKHRNKQVAGG